MNLPNPKDLIKNGAQFAYPIQWRRWEVINVFITQFNWKVGVEIGVNEGENIFEVTKNNPTLKMYGVESITRREMLKDALRYSNLEIIVDTSINASKQFDKESVDFVFIDGDHSYESVKNNIKYWEPKVKENGLIIGHDYNWGNVARAVGECFTEVWIMSDNVWAASKIWLRNERKNFNRQEK